MSRLTKLWAVALVLIAAGLHADDTLITIQSTITAAKVQGAVVVGTMQLSIVNATDTTLSNVQLRLGVPVTGALGEGTVDVGTIDVDATATPIVEFRVDRTFFESGEPFVIRLTFRDVAGETRETVISVKRTIGGGR